MNKQPDCSQVISASRELMQEWVTELEQNTMNSPATLHQISALLTRSESTAQEVLTFGYTNWRGEYAVRTTIPEHVYFGSRD